MNITEEGTWDTRILRSSSVLRSKKVHKEIMVGPESEKMENQKSYFYEAHS